MKKSSSRKTAFLSLFMIILLALYVLFTGIELKQISQQHMQEVQQIKESEWKFIYGILKENVDKAYMNADAIKNKLNSDILAAYKGNMAQLRVDIENPVAGSKFSEVSRKNLLGTYINVDNDNNDPFIATDDGIVGDLSENCAKGTGISRSFDSEIDNHANKILAVKAITNLLEQNTSKLIGWEFLKSNNPQHIMLNDLTDSSLKEVFLKEGILGLSTYEFLQPAYILKDSDIFGVPTISTSGHKVDNDRIIIVQGFNIVDELNRSHLTTISLFESQIDLSNQTYTSNRVIKEVMCLGFSACLLIVFLSIIKIQNMSEEDSL